MSQFSARGRRVPCLDHDRDDQTQQEQKSHATVDDGGRLQSSLQTFQELDEHFLSSKRPLVAKVSEVESKPHPLICGGFICMRRRAGIDLEKY